MPLFAPWRWAWMPCCTYAFKTIRLRRIACWWALSHLQHAQHTHTQHTYFCGHSQFGNSIRQRQNNRPKQHMTAHVTWYGTHAHTDTPCRLRTPMRTRHWYISRICHNMTDNHRVARVHYIHAFNTKTNTQSHSHTYIIQAKEHFELCCGPGWLLLVNDEFASTTSIIHIEPKFGVHNIRVSATNNVNWCVLCQQIAICFIFVNRNDKKWTVNFSC